MNTNIDFRVVSTSVRRRRATATNSREYYRQVRDGRRPSIVYASFKDENVLENLVSRFSRPYKALTPYVKQMLDVLFGLTNVDVRWSQKAGCSCGCSPGFIVKDLTGYDIWLTVAGPTIDPEKADLVENRIAQVMADSTLAPFVKVPPTPPTLAESTGAALRGGDCYLTEAL